MSNENLSPEEIAMPPVVRGWLYGSSAQVSAKDGWVREADALVLCRRIAELTQQASLYEDQCGQFEAKIAELERERDTWMNRAAGAISLLPGDTKCGDIQRASVPPSNDRDGARYRWLRDHANLSLGGLVGQPQIEIDRWALMDSKWKIIEQAIDEKIGLQASPPAAPTAQMERICHENCDAAILDICASAESAERRIELIVEMLTDSVETAAAPTTPEDDLLEIARETSTLDCFFTGASCPPDCECLSARAGRAIHQRPASPPAAPTSVAPIAKMMVADGFVSWTRLYSPGLPDGMHDVFCAPVGPGEWVPNPIMAAPNTPKYEVPLGHFWRGDPDRFTCRHCGFLHRDHLHTDEASLCPQLSPETSGGQP